MKSILYILIFFIATSSILSGVLMMMNPNGALLNLNPAVLKHTPFDNFLIPAIVLTFIVGGVNLLAVLNIILQYRNQFVWSVAAGIVICGWIIIQMILIQEISWLHFLFLGMGMLMIFIGTRLHLKNPGIN